MDAVFSPELAVQVNKSITDYVGAYYLFDEFEQINFVLWDHLDVLEFSNHHLDQELNLIHKRAHVKQLLDHNQTPGIGFSFCDHIEKGILE